MCLTSDKSENSSLKNLHKRVATATALLATALLLSACGEEISMEDRARPVKIIVAKAAPQQRALTYSGEIKPRVESTLGFRISGKIVERLADVGDRVEEGAVLARLDATDLKLALASANATVVSARTRLEVARLALERAKSLVPKGYIAKSVLDARQLEYDAAKSALEAAESEARQAANAASYAELKAPAAGIITAVSAEPGSVVAAGSPVFTLAEAGEIEVEIDVPEHEVSRLALGQRGRVSLWADPGISGEATIREIAGSADPQSRTYRVRAAIASPPQTMRLGMTATLSLMQPVQRGGIEIPLTALAQGEDGISVFVVDSAQGTVSRRTLETGALTPNGITVLSGLKDGDIVVTGGVQFLKDGMKVKLSEDALRLAHSAVDPEPR